MSTQKEWEDTAKQYESERSRIVAQKRGLERDLSSAQPSDKERIQTGISKLERQEKDVNASLRDIRARSQGEPAHAMGKVDGPVSYIGPDQAQTGDLHGPNTESRQRIIDDADAAFMRKDDGPAWDRKVNTAPKDERYYRVTCQGGSTDSSWYVKEAEMAKYIDRRGNLKEDSFRKDFAHSHDFQGKYAEVHVVTIKKGEHRAYLEGGAAEQKAGNNSNKTFDGGASQVRFEQAPLQRSEKYYLGTNECRERLSRARAQAKHDKAKQQSIAQPAKNKNGQTMRK